MQNDTNERQKSCYKSEGCEKRGMNGLDLIYVTLQHVFKVYFILNREINC